MNYIIIVFERFKREYEKYTILFLSNKNSGKHGNNVNGNILIYVKKKSPTSLGIFYSKETVDYLLLSLILAFLPVSSLK